MRELTFDTANSQCETFSFCGADGDFSISDADRTDRTDRMKKKSTVNDHHSERKCTKTLREDDDDHE